MSCCGKATRSYQGTGRSGPSAPLSYITCPKCKGYAFRKRAYNANAKVYEDVYICPSCSYSYPPRG